jgi:hypothetical protein
MRLVLERASRRDWLGRRWYRLAAYLEVDTVERAVIATHRLEDVELWASTAFDAFEREAESAFEAGANVAGWFLSREEVKRKKGLNKSGLKLVKHGRRREGCVSVGDLLEGAVLEAREVAELLGAEGGLEAGFGVLEARLEMLARYEDADTRVLEPEATPGTHPAGWVILR